VIVGKTNLPELAMWGQFTESKTYGPTRNPWNPERASGGSSGGSAVAVAAGMVAGALGSDGGASIRVPGAMCGIVGIQPLHGRVLRRALRRERAIAARINKPFDDVDVLITPTVAQAAEPVGAAQKAGAARTFNRGGPYVAYTAQWNYTGQPAAAIPAGFDD